MMGDGQEVYLGEIDSWIEEVRQDTHPSPTSYPYDPNSLLPRLDVSATLQHCPSS